MVTGLWEQVGYTTQLDAAGLKVVRSGLPMTNYQEALRGERGRRKREKVTMSFVLHTSS